MNVMKVLDELDVTLKQKEKIDLDVDMFVTLKTAISNVDSKDLDVTSVITDVVQSKKKRTLTTRLNVLAFD